MIMDPLDMKGCICHFFKEADKPFHIEVDVLCLREVYPGMQSEQTVTA